jgi:hypothetical protein
VSNPQKPVSYWQSLSIAADEGNLFLGSEAAAKCSRACDGYLDKLREHQTRAKELAKVEGLGEFESGKALRNRFAEKAMGGPNNLVDVLQSHIDVVTEMQVVFKKFFDDTIATDDQNASSIVAGPR